MSQTLAELLETGRTELINDVSSALRDRRTPHYAELDAALLRSWVGELTDALVSAMDHHLAFAEHLQRITEERIAQGFELREILVALAVLEERCWRMIVCATPLAEQVVRLALLTSIVGGARDQLACTYLDCARRAESRVRRLQARLEALFGGTDPCPEVEP